MRIRRARPEDYPAIGELTVAAYEEFLTGADDGYREQLRDVEGRGRDAELWVATSDDSETILGNVTICPAGSPWRQVAKPGEGEFRMLAVSPDARRQGVGGALVDLVLSRSREQGAHAVVMSSLSEMTGAHRIYQRLGFERLSERDWRPMPEVNLITFRKAL
ncbi:MAG: mshD 7 [Nocardioides sp.]|nr:mshD 7 [Nocardioides sp.]